MKIFCSGIGGIGLSAYAALQRAQGHEVFGSDRADSALLQDLRSQGITVSLAQDGSALPADLDLFVYSEAVPVDAPERVLAAQRGVRSLSYFHALGELSAGYRVIGVCGTHGKSSTTAMTARMLIACGLDPTVVVGTKVPELGGRNFRIGKSDLFLVESCEYRRSFHFLSPAIVLMTNVDGDHFDAYADVAEYQQAFVDFLARLPADGAVITHGSDADCARVAQQSGRRVVDADAQPLVPLAVPGRHMQQNAQLSLALAAELGVAHDAAVAALAGFAGTWRRMEVKGTILDDVVVVDDYAHHPVEIRATLQAMRSAHPHRRIVVAFQPHTHDRTLKLYDDFVTAFVDADVVVVPGVYNARKDIEHGSVDVPRFVSDLAAGSAVEALETAGLDAAREQLLRQVLRPHDLLVCMGAGDITSLAQRLVAA